MTQLQSEDAIYLLISFSLIKESGIQRHSFEIYYFVQISIRNWLKSNNQLGLWSEKSAEILAATFPSGEFDTWPDVGS